MQERFFRLGAFAALLILAGLAACEKVEDLLRFKLSNETHFTVPSAIGLNLPTLLPTPDVTTNASQTFQNNNTDINKVKDIRLESLVLSITSPAGATFAPVKSVRLYISAPGVEEKLLASKENIPTDTGSTLSLDVTGEKMDNFVKRESFQVRTEVVTRQAVFQDTDITAKMTFGVTADL
ncbi:MAG: hypothetical protein ICV83_04875 [Cytophagales bacterium]|nr:hypothetical protein [Cytophagales bacterium]